MCISCTLVCCSLLIFSLKNPTKLSLSLSSPHTFACCQFTSVCWQQSAFQSSFVYKWLYVSGGMCLQRKKYLEVIQTKNKRMNGNNKNVRQTLLNSPCSIINKTFFSVQQLQSVTRWWHFHRSRVCAIVLS